MEERKFELVSDFKMSGDQPEATEKLVSGLFDGLKNQVLLGVTGSGKTFTMANIIQSVQKPTLIIAHNKTLAAQLCNEFRDFFPNNRVEFFVSYYDYYQPEAYIASSDTYIEKDMAVNDEIDKLRNSATASLLERTDTIVVASVSCIYGLGNPEEYFSLQFSVREGDSIDRNVIIRKLLDMNFNRSDVDFVRSTFRVRGDVLEVFPSYSSEIATRIEFFGNEIDKISEFEVVTGKKIREVKFASFFPASHFAVGNEKLNIAIKQIENDMENEVAIFEKKGKLLEAQRLRERVSYNVEMMKNLGYCSGIENYSRYFDGRKPGEPPFTLMDYFPDGFLTIIDESHMTVPQVRAMFSGDRSRKESLVDYGFRLESAFDNRPLTFSEFEKKLGQTIFVSATPGEYEKKNAGQIVEQIIRPTGLLDPVVEVVPTHNQIDILLDHIREVVKKGERVLITTLTKKMAEDLSTYLIDHSFRAMYMHSEIDTLERIEIVNGLRSGEFDILVGINLLREGLDLPEVSLVAILDADKEGFLRSEGALIQTIGRASRNENGRVILFADTITDSMRRAISETNRRRKIQKEYNKVNGITPRTIIKQIKNTLEISKKSSSKNLQKSEIPKEIESLKALMKIASNSLDFENAIRLRDEISELKKRLSKNG